jgi:3-hydroxyisobutyrate dehydrogenase-like beta-hydroxyacid dehydrogenase
VTIAFLGLGRMGTPMACHLTAAGHTVLGFDPHPFDAAALERAGITLVEAVDDLRASDTSISMLPTPQAAEAALAGPGGLFEVVDTGHLHLHMGTSGPETVRRLAAAADAHGVRFVDAPVSGSVPAARAASLTTMVGGAAPDVARSLPLLQAMTRQQTHVGEVGDGSVVKLAVNLTVAALNQAVAEAMLLVEAAGVDPERFYGVLQDSAAGAPYVAYKRDSFLRPQETPVIAAMTVLSKDVGLAQDLAAASGLRLPLVDVTAAALLDASRHGEDALDCAEIGRAVRRLSDPSAATPTDPPA